MDNIIKIDLNDSVYNICTAHNKIKDLLFNLGFDKINNKVMFNTVAKVMTLDKAIKLKNINFEEVKKVFFENNFILEKTKENTRNDILKDIIVRLHSGENADILKKEFDEKLKTVSAFETHNAMNELIESGMEIDEAQQFFYMRSLLLHNSMDSGDLSVYDNYSFIKLFKEENREIENIIKNIEFDNIEYIKNLYNNIKIHYQKKENLFFTALNKYGNKEPSKVMTLVNRQILEDLESFIKNPNKEKLNNIKENINDMIFKEENILIPLLVSTLKEEDLENINNRYN